MEREIEEQPAALRRKSPDYATELAAILRGREFEMVLLVARGSSDHAALYARYLIEIHLAIPVVLAAPSVLTRFKTRVRYPRALAVGISQSGSAPDVSEVIAAMREDGHVTLGISNTMGSRLAREAENSLFLDVGNERSVAATKTYSSSLLALYQLAAALGADLPMPELPDEDWLRSSRAKAKTHAQTVIGARPLFALGRGYSFCTANEAALKLMECALLPCKAYSTADFQHGPKALASVGSAILAFSNVGSAVAEQGGEVLAAPVAAGVPEESLPMWQCLYAQWLALECARERGEDPDQPQFIEKVTRTL